MQNTPSLPQKVRTLLQLLPPDELETLAKEVPAGETPLWQYWEEFIMKKARADRSLVTSSNARDTLRLILRHTGIRSIEQCNDANLLEDTLYDLRAKRKTGGSTLNTWLKNLKTYFIWLEKKGFIEKNNLHNVEKSKEVQNEQLVLNHEQVKELMAHLLVRENQTQLERARNLFLFSLLSFTGARPCELMDLKLEDIRTQKKGYEIRINGKKQKGKPRYYTLPSSTRDIYENYMYVRARFRRTEEALIISTSSLGGLTTKGLIMICKRLSKELGFRVNAYGFRRYVATQQFKEGVSIQGIGNFLGHTRKSTTELYIERTCFLTQEGSEAMKRVWKE